ncbi:MAG: sulfurtransferase-like selenium metabolism protein YedF [Lachnospiraceae bacterium]|nr:sulfurtransferase-like selenium metabolism protein YedF [Lachnospiraceae bacterium]
MNPKKIIDAIGAACPVPVVRAMKALEAAKTGDVLEVLVDNEMAVQNLMKMAKNRGCTCQVREEGTKRFAVTIVAGTTVKLTANEPKEEYLPGDEPAMAEAAAHDVAACEAIDSLVEKGTVVVIDSAFMGRGDEALGTVLMKGFIYALSQQGALPETMLFYNSGVKLTTETSETLEDLKGMEALGVGIYSCGTCLDFYGLKEQLLVGEVTNMYDIVERMTQALKLIRP